MTVKFDLEEMRHLQLATFLSKEEILCWCDDLKGGAVAARDEKERFWQVLLVLQRLVVCND